MIKEFVKAWDLNKQNLEDWFRNTDQSEYEDYRKIVIALFESVINPYISAHHCSDECFNTDNITVLDHGEYQGTKIFIIPKDRYQPYVEDYVYTHNFYGSCGGCDALMRINEECPEGKPSEDQIKEYMTLALHLLQRCKYMEDADNEEEEGME